MVVANFESTTKHGSIDGKTQTHIINYYNLDMIISVGYRVKSKNGIIFRKWANKVLKDYLIKGYAVNQKKLDILEKTAKLINIVGKINLFVLKKVKGLKSIIDNIYDIFDSLLLRIIFYG